MLFFYTLVAIAVTMAVSEVGWRYWKKWDGGRKIERRKRRDAQTIENFPHLTSKEKKQLAYRLFIDPTSEPLIRYTPATQTPQQGLALGVVVTILAAGVMLFFDSLLFERVGLAVLLLFGQVGMYGIYENRSREFTIRPMRWRVAEFFTEEEMARLEPLAKKEKIAIPHLWMQWIDEIPSEILVVLRLRKALREWDAFVVEVARSNHALLENGFSPRLEIPSPHFLTPPPRETNALFIERNRRRMEIIVLTRMAVGIALRVEMPYHTMKWRHPR